MKRTTPAKRQLPEILDVEDLDDLQARRRDGRIAGRTVVWYDNRPYALVLDAERRLRIAMPMACGRCGRPGPTLFLGRGGSGWSYGFDYAGRYVAHLRDQEWRCDDAEGCARTMIA